MYPQVDRYVLPCLHLCCRNKAENARLKAVDTRNKSEPLADPNRNNRPLRQTDETSDCSIQAASANSLPRAPEKARREHSDSVHERAAWGAEANIPQRQHPRLAQSTRPRGRLRSTPGGPPGSVSYSSPNSAFSGVIGSERTYLPVACATALAMAPSGVLMTTSPIDFAPNGPVGS